jgi:hypothetical protein
MRFVMRKFYWYACMHGHLYFLLINLVCIHLHKSLLDWSYTVLRFDHILCYERSWCRGAGVVCGWMLEGESTPSSGCRCAELGRESISVTGFGERRGALLPRACSISASCGVCTPVIIFPKSCLRQRPKPDISAKSYALLTLTVVTSSSIREGRLPNLCVGCSICCIV